jgi:hypothetical protein
MSTQIQITSDLHLVGAGMCLSLVLLCIGSIGATRGINLFNLIAMLQTVNATAALVALVIGIISYVLKAPTCAYSILGVVFYLIAELAVDGYLLSLVCVTVQPGKRGKLIQWLWIIGFLVFDAIPRLVSFTVIRFEVKGNFCNISSHPIAGITTNASLNLFAIVMGVNLAWSLISSRQHVLTTVGIKSAIFCIIMVVVKIGFYVPYILQVIGPYSIVFLYFQFSLECVLLNASVYWKSKVNSVPFTTTKSIFSASSNHRSMQGNSVV